MIADTESTYTVFKGAQRMAQGELREVAKQALSLMEAEPEARVFVFNDRSGKIIDLDLRGVVVDPPPRSVGRPKLGVVAREVTLLPCHWDWLNQQSGGASVAIRKLVDEARRTRGIADRRRAARDATYEFLFAIAGDAPGYEEAMRALYRGNREQFESLISTWSGDIPQHARQLSADAFLADETQER